MLEHVIDLATQAAALAPAPAPTGGTPTQPGGSLATSNIVTFFASRLAPILLGGLGVIFIARANKGEVGKVLTSSMVAVIGLVFIAGAATFYLVGPTIISLMFE